jgi:preprotein translocase subunit SecG
MKELLLSVHILTCLLVILVVLLQSGKGAGFSGLFGGGSEALFSAPSGSSFIRKVTSGFAVAFFLTSLALTWIAAREDDRRFEQFRNLVSPTPAATPEPAKTDAAPPPAGDKPVATAPAPAAKK